MLVKNLPTFDRVPTSNRLKVGTVPTSNRVLDIHPSPCIVHWYSRMIIHYQHLIIFEWRWSMHIIDYDIISSCILTHTCVHSCISLLFTRVSECTCISKKTSFIDYDIISSCILTHTRVHSCISLLLTWVSECTCISKKTLLIMTS